MKQATRRSERTSLSASLVAAGLTMGLCGCSLWQPKPLLGTRDGIVPPPYQAPAATTAAAVVPASPQPAFPPVPEGSAFPAAAEFETPVPPATTEDIPDEKKDVSPPVVEIVLPAVPEVTQITYTVKKNDSLWLIAQRYGITYQELAAANSLNPDAVLKEGKVLVIPPGGRPGAAGEGHSATVRIPGASGAKPAAAAATGTTSVYTVQRGDCLSTIAARHKMKTAELRKLNELSDDKIFIGQKLRVSGTAVASAAASTGHTKPTAPTTPTGGATTPTPPAGGGTTTPPTTPTGGGPTIPPTPPTGEGPATAPTTPAGGAGAAIPGVPNDPTDDDGDIRKVPAPPIPPAPAAGAALRKLPHDVCKDDTLENIAEIYGTTVTAILQANPTIKSNADLEEGKTIMVPYK